MEASSPSQPNTQTTTVLQALQLEPHHLGALPPELRDQLLDYARTWAAPAERLDLTERLSEAHGPLLFLLDHQAEALFHAGDRERALATIERRQRRSSTIGSQALEAQTLLAAGHFDRARAVADDISTGYPDNITALAAAARVYAVTGEFYRSKALLDGYLAKHSNHLLATLALAELAHLAGEQALAADFVERLGGSIPPGIEDAPLRVYGDLLEQLGRSETAKAVQLELERRRRDQLLALRKGLAPLLDQPTAASDEALEGGVDLFRHLSSPDAVPVSRDERQRILVESARNFGYSRLRSGQLETMATVLRGESILTVMPTGAGKSLCYQLPALIQEKATLVISPLIALMKDQVEGLPAAARRQATFVNSTLSEEEMQARLKGISQGEYKLIYAAPERLRQRGFLRVLRDAGLDLFVVDEAHCVSLWGHDFRPDYLFIQEARHELGDPPALAMTATAPPRVRDEIIAYITADAPSIAPISGAGDTGGEDEPARPRVIALDIFRSNLELSALRFHNEDEKLVALLDFVTKPENSGSGIVYVNSRAKAEGLAFHLREAGVAAEAYHAGLADRGAVQDRFMQDRTRVVVATVAFGMGIDKADIRFIVHFHPPRSLAAYYQEVGRAGRDGKLSKGVLFYSNNDWANLRRWAKADEYPVDFLMKVYQAVATQLPGGAELAAGVGKSKAQDETEAGNGEVQEGYEEGNGEIEPAYDEGDNKGDDTAEAGGAESPSQAGMDSSPLKPAIGPVDTRRLQQVLNSDETTVRVAVSMLERAGLLSRSFDLPRELEIGLPARLPKAALEDRAFKRLLERGLQLTPGRSATYPTADIATFMRCEPDQAEAELLGWQSAGWLRVKGGRPAMYIELPPPPEETRERLERLLDQANAVAQRRIDEMVGYATAESCRHGYISAHFGSPPRSRCDVCDFCRPELRPEIPPMPAVEHTLPDDVDIEPMIVDALISLPKPVGRGGLARVLAGSLRAPAKPDEARHHGRLKALGEGAILEYIDELLDEGRLRQYERQGYLVLAPTLRGRAEAEVWLEEHPEMAARGAGEEEPPDIEESAGEEPPDIEEGEKYTALQKALWLWRRRTAEQMGQPPYVIMSNETMLTIAERRPHSEDKLAEVPGMGAARLSSHGAVILDLINLTPPQPGDEALLRAQREQQAQTAQKVKEKIEQKIEQGAKVSPRVERQIYLKLQEMRQKTAVRTNGKPYQVASNNLLKAIAAAGPGSMEELEAILGFRGSGLADQGTQILAVVEAAKMVDGGG